MRASRSSSSFRERLDTFFSILAAVFSAPRPFFSFFPFLPIAPIRKRRPGDNGLEEEALRRKERLKALREKTGRKDREDGEPQTKQLREEGEEVGKHRGLRLRNYVPEDEDLKRRRVPQAKPVAVEEKVKEQLEAAKPEPVIEEVDLANLAPRKPDWDLKRDVAKKLEKLEKRTQRAIAELIRERLKGQEDSLASAVDATTGQEACDSD